MTAPLYLLDDGALAGVTAGARLTLDGDEARHAATVRRTRVGERVDVADGSGSVARCCVTAVAPARVELTVERVDQEPQRVPLLVLVQALAKGGRDELAVETATELGVDVVMPWQAARSVVVWAGERGERSRRKWESVARAAAKQSRRARVPLVEHALTTKALAARVATTCSDGGLALVLHEEGQTALAVAELPTFEASPARSAAQVLVVVGPEGGIGGDELAVLVQAGAIAVRLGPEVLRTSSAGAAALAVLSVRLGRWVR